MKTPAIIELESQRSDIVRDARAKLDEIKNNTDPARFDALDREHDALMRSFDLIEHEIRQAEAESATGDQRDSRRPGSSGAAAGTDDGSHTYGTRNDWMDERGQPVRVLSRGERLSERSYTGPTLGDLIRAKVTGPRNEDEKRALSEGTDSAGGYTVPAPLSSDFIDLMRAKSVAMQAGAVTVPMTSETLAIARVASDPTVAWRAENAAVAEGDPTFDRVAFTAKTLAGYVKVSRELMEDSINVGRILDDIFARAMAQKLDYAAIFGDGSGNSPTGVAETSGINAVSMGTNGAALADYDKLIDAVYELQVDNADDPTAMIMHPRSNAALAKLKDANDNPLTVPDMIARIPRLATSAAPIDETQGTATNASSIILGDFRQLMIGMRHQIEVRVFDQPFATTGQVAVLAWMRADVQLAQPKAFCALNGIIPA